MGKLLVFNFVTLNGFFKGPGEDISWHKNQPEDQEKSAYGLEGANSGGILLFGRVTYTMMASFWPSPEAKKLMPAIAEGMNKSEKIVFSRTMKKADWNNTRVVKDNMIEEIKKLKKTSDKGMCILGSGSITNQLAEAGLIDEYQFMVDPVAIGEGTPLFNGIGQKLELKLTGTKSFKSGVVLLTYQPA